MINNENPSTVNAAGQGIYQHTPSIDHQPVPDESKLTDEQIEELYMSAPIDQTATDRNTERFIADAATEKAVAYIRETEVRDAYDEGVQDGSADCEVTASKLADDLVGARKQVRILQEELDKHAH